MDAFNHPIFNNPNTTITSGGFGRITSVSGTRNALGASGSRAIQIGACIDFQTSRFRRRHVQLEDGGMYLHGAPAEAGFNPAATAKHRKWMDIAMNDLKVTYVVHIATTAQKLWAALTNREVLRNNWGKIESEWTKGSRVTEVDDSGKVLWKGEVRRSEPPRVLSFTFDVTDSGEPPTEVTFELGPPVSPIAQGTEVVQLCITQVGFEENSKLATGCARAWPEILSSIKTYVETGRPLGFAWKH